MARQKGLAVQGWKLRGQLRDFVLQVRDYDGLTDCGSSRGGEKSYAGFI